MMNRKLMAILGIVAIGFSGAACGDSEPTDTPNDVETPSAEVAPDNSVSEPPTATIPEPTPPPENQINSSDLAIAEGIGKALDVYEENIEYADQALDIGEIELAVSFVNLGGTLAAVELAKIPNRHIRDANTCMSDAVINLLVDFQSAAELTAANSGSDWGLRDGTITKFGICTDKFNVPVNLSA